MNFWNQLLVGVVGVAGSGTALAQTAESLIHTDNASGAKVYASESDGRLHLRSVGPPDVFVSYKIDVNNNGIPDARVDVEYGSGGGKGCPQYTLSATSSTFCGEFKTGGTYSEEQFGPSKVTRWSIPLKELSTDGTRFGYTITFWNDTRKSRQTATGRYRIGAGTQSAQQQAPQPAAPVAANLCDMKSNATFRQVADACTALLARGEDPAINRTAVFYIRAFARHYMAMPTEAIQDLSEALKLVKEPKDRGEVLALRALARSARDKPGALADVVEALKADPDQPLAYHVRAIDHEEKKNYAAALADADRAVALSPEASDFNNSACWVRVAFLRRDYARARELCDRAIKAQPTRGAYLDSRAVLNLREKKWQQAHDDFNKAYQATRDARYLYGRGIALVRLGRSAEGDKDIAEALAKGQAPRQEFAEIGITRDLVLP